MVDIKESPGQFIGRITFENADNLFGKLESVIPKGDGGIISCIVLELYFLVYFIVTEKPDLLNPTEMTSVYTESLEMLAKRSKSWTIKSASGPFEGDILPYDHSTLSLGMMYWMVEFLQSFPDFAKSGRAQQLEDASVFCKRRILEGLGDTLDVETAILLETQIDSTLTQLINSGLRLTDSP